MFYQLDVRWGHREEGQRIEKLPPKDWLVGKSVGHFLKLMIMWEGPVHCGWYHPWVGKKTPSRPGKARQ